MSCPSAYGTRYGGRVALHDVDGDKRAELMTGPGPDSTAKARLESFSYDGSALNKSPGGFTAFTGSYGVNVAAGSFGW